ncbi:MAG: tetratricopeptide repeat protein [Cytophagaceae bacterium]|nr:tetratricopeptide repeat protein [Cytophagaceae bacterium]
MSFPASFSPQRAYPASLLLWVLLLLLAPMGCETGKKNTTESTSVSLEIPPLFQRKGELAKAVEWEKTQSKVEELKQKIAKNPNDLKARLQVVTIYLAEARITGEHPYYYPAILTILDGILSLDPANFEATVFKASVKMSQHQFAEAKTIAEKALKLNPDNAYVYGVLVDANVELGNYEEAVAMSDKMQRLRPSLEAYSRASYLREIYGDYPGAIEAMKLAVQAGLPGSEPYCWSKNTLGYLYETTGKLAQAEIQYQEILALRPSYAFALRGLAQVQKDRKQYDKALSVLDSAARIMPEFSFHEEMAEIYALQGDVEKANRKYLEVVGMLGEDARSGHRVDLELCKTYTAAGLLDSARVYGLREYAMRPKNIDVNHALAWVYFKQNNLVKAREHLQVALRTGAKYPDLLARAEAIKKGINLAKSEGSFLTKTK